MTTTPDLITEAKLTAQDLTKIHPNMLSRQALKDTAALLERLASELTKLRALADQVEGTVPVPEDMARDISTVISKAGHHNLVRTLDAIPALHTKE